MWPPSGPLVSTPEDISQYITDTRTVLSKKLFATKDFEEFWRVLESVKVFSIYVIKVVSLQTDPGNPDDIFRLWELIMSAAMSQFNRPDWIMDRTHDYLVNLVLWTREFDVQCRVVNPPTLFSNVAPPLYPNWDAYGFGYRMRRFIEYGMSNQRISSHLEGQKLRCLAAFSAKCFAHGLCPIDLGMAAMMNLKLALERLELNMPQSAVNITTTQKMLLPSALAWIQHSQHRMLSLSMDCTFSTGAGAEIFESYSPDIGLAKTTKTVDGFADLPPGFNVARWIHWRQVVYILAQNPDPDIAIQGRKAWIHMINCGREMGYDVPGEEFYFGMIQKSMEEARRATKPDSVWVKSMSDINADFYWAGIDQILLYLRGPPKTRRGID
ncbi:hypothetical protein CONLIGDRAFT_718332 [Coniochaeta ligniaria NRRL 30616]|uniref:Uncharacterized protein n=1 Tax=Coniochaeta ligniaria NRRL 30616 TaxID=1408157 RepID=A0A1J7I9M6_9PEZI|nr:hypothetical protein CONLIGDRAFT_718332 [Coniochaeta ligniaria NRRL 30616]